jgi:hypothetical protein
MKKTAIAAAACAFVATSGLAAARVTQYDAFFAPAANTRSFAAVGSAPAMTGKLARRLNAKVARADIGPRGIKSNFDARLGGNTFLWLKDGQATAAKAGGAPMKRARLAETTARDALKHNASALVVGRSGLADAKLTELQDNGKSAVIARFQQRVGGYDVFNRQINVLMDHDLAPKAISGYFAPDAQVLAAKKSPGTFSLTGAEAIAIAFKQMGGSVATGALHVTRTAGEYSLYNVPASSADYRLAGAPRVKQVMFADKDRLVPAYYVELAAGAFDVGTTDRYSFVVAADSGKLLFRNNQVAYDAYSYDVYADAGGIHQPYDGPLGNSLEPLTVGPDGPFVRTPAAQNTITISNGPIASNDPWLPPGATTTEGNNANAYVDLDDYLLSDGQTHGTGDDGNPVDGYTPGNGLDFLGTTSAPGTFVYPYAPDTDPATLQQRQAAITNLFYMNNWLHDWWYRNGFDEAAGNAQLDNYGRGGIDGDPIEAQGQDGSGTNNANMSTPSDGGSPRMQMYIFKILENSLTVNSPPSVAGELDSGTAAFGPSTFDLTADVAPSVPADACDVPSNVAELAGKIALVARGTCTFVVKVKNAQLAGAAGVIIHNNVAGGGAIGFAGEDDTVTIPSLGISLEDGNALRTALASGPVNVTMHELTKIDRDGTMDNGIIAHEWFHYVSNRLIADGNGLNNEQGRSMGEGWSDFSTMMLIVRPEDRMVPGNDHWQGAYSTGTYVDDNQYFGIRRTPYSTDMAVNPLTFKHIESGVPLPDTAPIAFGQSGADNSEVHNSGEIWANVLWEIYASLLNDPRYSFDQAQERMKDYVIAALKITPASPTFLEARDALLAVANVTDATDFDLMAKAFAKRGMGFGAVAPDRNDDTHSGAVESFEPYGSAFEVEDASLDFAFDDGTQGYCDLDGVFDAGETTQLTVKIRSTGTAPITLPITARIGAPANVTFPAGDTITFSSLGLLGDELTGTVLLKLDTAATASELPLQILFPQIVTDNNTIDPQTVEIDLAVDYDLVAASSSDDMEARLASMHDWSVDNLLPTALPSWSVQAGADLDGDGSFFNTGHVWYAPDNDGASELTLATPDLVVGGDEFTFSFTHYFQMEYAGDGADGKPIGWDGGVIQISVDGGDWSDALTSTQYPVTVTAGTGYNGRAIVFDPNEEDEAKLPPAFVDYNQNGFEPVTLSFGTALAGHTVRLRFLEASDEAFGEFGWVVDNVSFTGLSNKPFTTVAADAASCVNRPPHANAGPDLETRGSKKHEDRTLRLNGSVADLDGSEGLSYTWTQVSGETVTITGANTLTPSISIPRVDESTELVFRLTVSDGVASGTDDMKLSVTKSPGGGGGGAMGLGLLLFAPLALLYRRRRLPS